MRAIGEHIALEPGQRFIILRVYLTDAPTEMDAYDFSCFAIIDGDVATIKGLPDFPDGMRSALEAEINRIGGYEAKWVRHRPKPVPTVVLFE